MPKHLSLATVVDKNKIASSEAFLMLLEVEVRDPVTGQLDETVYLVRNDEDIFYQGQLYTKSAFEFSVTEAAGEIPEVSVGIEDPTGSVIERAERHHGGVGWKIRMKYISTANITQPPEVEEMVYVMGSKARNYRMDFVLGARNPLAQRFPRRLQWRDRCSWLYKSTDCGYAGALPSCDYSLQGGNGCAAHGNTQRFGGFPGIAPR